MLNEWIETSSILKSIGCDFGVSHPNFKSCPNKKGYIVYLDKNGQVEDVDIPDFDMGTVYKWQKGKMDPSFPVFSGRAFYEVTCDPGQVPANIIGALRGKNTKGQKDEAAEQAETQIKPERTIAETKLQVFLTGCNDLWNDQQDLKLIGRCFNELPQELHHTYLDTAEPKPGGYGAYKELVRRAALCQPENFRFDVRDILLKKLLTTGKKEFAEVLFAFKKKDKKKGRGKEYGKDFQFLLSIKDWDNSEYGQDRFPPYHTSFQKWMSQTFELHSKKLYEPIGMKDAFGLDMAGSQENFDDIDAAGLGQIKLFAAYEKIPCLMRYGLKSTEIFPAGRNARESGRKALEYILDSNRRGTTWISLRKYENRNTVAFAYCSKLNNVNAIKVFDNDDTDDMENIYISEESTKTALKTLEGIAESEPAAQIVIGIIASVDKGNTKFLLSRRCPISYYLSGARRWQEGCANIPEIVLPKIENKGKEFKGALPIYPTRAIWLLNSEWRQNGEMIMRKQGNQKVPISKRFALSDALDLLFESDDTIQARVVAGLGSVVQKSAYALIMARLKATLDRYEKGNKISFSNSDYLHMLPTLYGLLLHKKGIKKEDYMNEALFDLGRYFAVVDDLYIQYHMDVRSGSVPMSLLGNDNVKLALQNPLDGYLNASSRLLHPYMTWAKRIGTNDKPGQIAKNCIGKLAGLSEILSKVQLPTDIDDVDRAKLLLGYLSYGAKKTGQNMANGNENQIEEGEQP